MPVEANEDFLKGVRHLVAQVLGATAIGLKLSAVEDSGERRSRWRCLQARQFEGNYIQDDPSAPLTAWGTVGHGTDAILPLRFIPACAGNGIKRPSWRNPKSEAQWRSSLANYAKPLHKTPVDAIETADVLGCI